MLKLILIAVLATLVNCNSEYFEKYYGDKNLPENKNGDARIVGGERASDRVVYQISMQMQTNGNGGGFWFFQQPASNWS